MHSSIFNFNRDFQWRLSLLGAAVVALLFLAFLEIYFRSQGFDSTVLDDERLWAFYRQRANASENTLTLIGASRMQIDLSSTTLKHLFPKKQIVQLAIDGTHPIATLRNLSEDPEFCGFVLCSIIAPGFERRNWDHQQNYVDFYKHLSTFNISVNRYVSALLQSWLVILNPQANLKSVFERVLETGRKPAPNYLKTLLNRFRQADYTKVNIKEHREVRIDRLEKYYDSYPPYNPQRWLKEALEVNRMVRKIKNKGGDVVFIRLPTSGEHWEKDEKFYPKNRYWDQFAKRTNAKTLHFKDESRLNHFILPDYSHLDYRDSPSFTRKIIAILLEKNIPFFSPKDN